MYRVGSSYGRKNSCLQEKERDIYVKVEEITEEEARFYADDSDVIEINVVYIVDEKPYLKKRKAKCMSTGSLKRQQQPFSPTSPVIPTI